MSDYQIDLKRALYTKDSYNRVIDTEFKNFGVTTYEDDIKKFVSVDEFFEYYNQLFYDIPMSGVSNSHEYLAKRSGEYSEFDKDAEIINALQREIASLRREILNKDIKILELETGEKINTDEILSIE